MKKLFVLLLCGIAITQEIRAEFSHLGPTTVSGETLQDASFTGPTTLTDVKAESINVIGPLEFHNLEVKGTASITGPISESQHGVFKTLEITGPFEATDVICDTFEAAGPMTVKNLTVKKEVMIGGPLKASQSHFPNLIIEADEIVLTDTNIEGDILIQQDKNKNKKQILRLLGKTNVKGSISFESGSGIIERDSNVKVQGVIKGATVIKQ